MICVTVEIREGTVTRRARLTPSPTPKVRASRCDRVTFPGRPPERVSAVVATDRQ